MMSIEDRSAIVAYHKRGMPIPVIAKTLKLHREQVHRVINRYQETGEVKDRHRSGRSRTARTPALREKVRHKIQRDPQRSIRKANLLGFWDKEVWPSNSPDLNPLDFAVWSIMEQKACAVRHKSIDSLKRALEKAWDEITPEMIASILHSFRKRLNACIAAGGSHFECE
ncbi:hypothetical protein QR680_003576 [Steinernema hermaphroditum]|uniref:Paired domain-containing protein n=1 Tax=Steinernema hermaphroditum TaxID=289476 RepID=A0AA39LRS6_9BILA|nr:hypothetical protein QR680_003576 [Steinernema hermaphroditum]